MRTIQKKHTCVIEEWCSGATETTFVSDSQCLTKLLFKGCWKVITTAKIKILKNAVTRIKVKNAPLADDVEVIFLGDIQIWKTEDLI